MQTPEQEHIREKMAPDVIGAYLKGDLETLRANCREQAFAQLNALVQERNSRNLLMDTRILHMSEPELEGIRIISGLPTPVRLERAPSRALHRSTHARTRARARARLWLPSQRQSPLVPRPLRSPPLRSPPRAQVVSFEIHQLHCIRSRLTASIVEGDEDDIRAVHYLWALQPLEEEDPELPEEQQWQVTELAVRGMMSTY